jgi:multisubunit Na+/H+ antiporter MnhC subunit
MKNILILIALAAITYGTIVKAISINDEIKKVLQNISNSEPEVNKHAQNVEKLAAQGFLQGDRKLPAYKKAEMILIKLQHPLQKLQSHFEHLKKIQLLNSALMLILVISTWWFYSKKINRIKNDIKIAKKAVISTISMTTKTTAKCIPQILKHTSNALKYIPQILVIAIGIALGLTIYTTFK